MALLFIRQYTRLAHDENGQVILAGLEPGQDLAPVSFGGGADKIALSPGTKFVRLHTDAICSYACGANTVAATTSNARLAANQTEFFGISSAVTHIAVIGNT